MRGKTDFLDKSKGLLCVDPVWELESYSGPCKGLEWSYDRNGMKNTIVNLKFSC